ncbi:hypothetical protein MALH05_00765 [Mycoplasma anatis]|nr:hypothetical protein [Mycoplasmopsis anatis]
MIAFSKSVCWIELLSRLYTFSCVNDGLLISLVIYGEINDFNLVNKIPISLESLRLFEISLISFLFCWIKSLLANDLSKLSTDSSLVKLFVITLVITPSSKIEALGFSSTNLVNSFCKLLINSDKYPEFSNQVTICSDLLKPSSVKNCCNVPFGSIIFI